MAQVRAHEIIGQVIAYGERKLKAETNVSAPLLAGVWDRGELIRAYRDAELISVQIHHLEDIELEIEFSSVCTVILNLVFTIKPWGHISKVKTSYSSRR